MKYLRTPEERRAKIEEKMSLIKKIRVSNKRYHVIEDDDEIQKVLDFECIENNFNEGNNRYDD